MTSAFSVPLAIALIVVGILVIIAAWVLHWLLVIVAIVLIAIGIYIAYTGRFPF